MRRALVAAVLVAACSHRAKPVRIDPPLGSDAEQPKLSAPVVDAPGPSQDEKLAAIQHAMNELDEAAQGCWAMAATDRFDIEGELTLTIDISATSAKASVVTDTARNAKLSACLVQLLSGYRWAPPLYGDTIQLPFKFKAPDGQSIIDRTLVEWHTQEAVSTAVLLDESNTGNAAASMIELAVKAGGSTGSHVTERTELWFFLTDGELKFSFAPTGKKGNGSYKATPGWMVLVHSGTQREAVAGANEMRAVVVTVPGGREGAARAGALPASIHPPDTALHLPWFAFNGETFGPATIYLDKTKASWTPLAASILELPAGAKVPEHVHANETELLYALEGSGTITINGQELAVTPTSVLQIPPNTKHAFSASAKFRALQIYTPAGPEQRFKNKP
jgi:quercetin dioxygenase-like cupin family protein